MRFIPDRRRFLTALSQGTLGACAINLLYPGSVFGKSRSSAAMTGYAYDPRCALYYQNSIEVPERVTWINRQLHDAGVAGSLSPVAPVVDPQPHIARVHTPGHIAGIHSIAVDEVNGGTEKIGVIADLAAALVIGATRDVCEGRIRNAFCNIRPPGHHQTNTGLPYGYCCYANAVIAARFALESFGDLIKKVLIVDWDYHHGNGTEALIIDDPSILFFDTCSGSFWTGGDETAHGLMDASSGNEGFLKEWEAEMLPLARAFKPDLIIISCGFDSKMYDIMGGLGLTARGYSVLTQKLMDLAEEFSHHRIVSVLEGGYTDNGSSPPTFNGLAQCAMTHVRTLLTGEVQEETPLFTGIQKSTRAGVVDNNAPDIRNGLLSLKGVAGIVQKLTVRDLQGRIVYQVEIQPSRSSLRISSCCPPSFLIAELLCKNNRRIVIPWDNF